MGNTTIIELNHDLYRAIEACPDDFVGTILEHLRGGNWEGKEILGGKVIACFNRSGVGIDKDWEAFKAKWKRDNAR